jgi:hypothetical protein
MLPTAHFSPAYPEGIALASSSSGQVNPMLLFPVTIAATVLGLSIHTKCWHPCMSLSWMFDRRSNIAVQVMVQTICEPIVTGLHLEEI